MGTPYTKLSRLWSFGMRISGLESGLKKYIKRLPLSLPPYPEILEIGCGTGIVSFAFLERFPNAHIIATDIDPKMLLVAAKIAFKRQIPPERLEFGEADANNPEEVMFLDKDQSSRIKPASFHCIAASGVMEHTDLELSLPVMSRILKPGGCLLFVNMRDNWCGKLYGKLYGFSTMSPEEFSRMLSINGFEEVESVPFTWNEFPTNITRTGIIARKKKS